MSFSLRPFTPPDFTQEKFQNAPNAVLVPCPKDGVAPEHYHAMSIFPEYFKVDGQWIMAKESRMDCVPVYENGVIYVREFRILKAGDLVFTGRTENCEHLRLPRRLPGERRPAGCVRLPAEPVPGDGILQGLR